VDIVMLAPLEISLVRHTLSYQEELLTGLAVLFGQGEVLVIVIVTALVVFLILYRRRKR